MRLGNEHMKCALVLSLLAISAAVKAQPSGPVTLSKVRELQCHEGQLCGNVDAVVFVHGIYGSAKSFTNTTTGFNWPASFPLVVAGRPIDVYTLEYQTALISWAHGHSASFDEIAESMVDALKPLRVKQYRSIGFIAHSLGGNFVTTYLTEVTLLRNHPARSQHGYMVTLATPVMGAQIADHISLLKKALGMQDDLLRSLQDNNLYLRMLNKFRDDTVKKGDLYLCRPVHLYAAYEEKYVGPVLVVKKDSAGDPIADVANSPIVGFPVNHLDIAKPAGPYDPIYKWALARISDEMIRLDDWDRTHESFEPGYRLCQDTVFKPET